MIRQITIAIGFLFFGAPLDASITTTTTLTSVTPAAPLFGQKIALTATVSPATAPGFVSFMDRGVLVGSGMVNPSGVAQATTIILSAGPHSLVAVYGGNTGGGYLASRSAVMPYNVTAVPGVGFAAAVNYPAGMNPVSVGIGDFNGDGKADFAVLNQGSGNVGILLGNGNGTFQTAVYYNTGPSPEGVVAADFNGDGKIDLAVTQSNGPSNGSITMLLGNGDGTFVAAMSSQVGNAPISITAGDFNGDGKVDLAFIQGNFVGILLGNGDGTFQPQVSYLAIGAVSVAVGDFSGDGVPDLEAVSSSGNLILLVGNGDGTFQSAASSYVNTGMTSVAVGDFNADGKLDFAAVNNNCYCVYVLMGNGNGTFQTAVPYGAGASPAAVAIGDFNGDGKPDLVVSDTVTNTVDVLLGNGDGTFQTGVQHAVGQNAISVGVGDFNGDGVADLAVVNRSDENVSVLLGKGVPTNPMGQPTSISLQTSSNPSAYGYPLTLTATLTPSNASGVVEFLDGSSIVGARTLVTGQAQITTILLPSGANALRVVYVGVPTVWLPSQSSVVSQAVNPVATAGFLPPVSYTAGSNPQAVVVGDFNGDGRDDLAVADYDGGIGGGVSVLLGNGNGTFQPAVSYVAGTAPFSVAIGDFNGDGKPDLVVANQNSNNVSVLLGNGDGSFQTSTNYYAGPGPASVVVGDFDGDGKADLAVADYGSNVVSVLIGNGNATFQTAATYNAASTPQSVVVGDFNGDSKADLAVANSGSGNVSVLLGNGDGTFQAPLNFGAGAGPYSVALGDFNADGKSDMAVANLYQNVSVLLGNGNGTFQTAVNYPAGSGPASIIEGDFNGDGKPDLAVANVTSNNVSVLLGTGNGPFQTAMNYPAGSGPGSVAMGDFNSDGRADLAVADYFGGVSILLGEAPAAPTGLQFYPVTPCRLVDTRGTAAGFNGIAPFSGPSILAGGTLTIPVQSTVEASANTTPAPCGTIPSTAQAYSLNVTVVPHVVMTDQYPGVVHYISLWPSGVAQPVVSTLNDSQGQILANAAIVPAGAPSGGISIYNAGPATVDVILDMNGYFAATTTQGASTGLQFFPVSPCRLVDTRGASAGFNGISPFSGPSLLSGATANIPVQSSAEASADTTPAPCGTIPSGAQAYSLNATLVPQAGALDHFITLWPSGLAQPTVSTLNDQQGEVVANAAIVPAGTPSGGVSVYNQGPATADVILDMNGYFAAPTGLKFYPVSPCRLVDTRGAGAGFNGISPFSGPSIAAGGTITIPVQSSSEASTNTTPAPCGTIPSTAQAYSLNLTVVPKIVLTDPFPGAINYLTIWPAGVAQPIVSTVNDQEALVVANAAIVPAGSGSGGISVYNAGPSATDVILDMNGYFAP